MNKALSLVLTTLLFLTLTTTVLAQTGIEPAGSGTTGDPYRIATWQNLYWVSQTPGTWGGNENFIQTANIDFADAVPAITTWDGNTGWTPIGNDTTKFTGTYDGGGHTINGLFINRAGDYQGLFGYIDRSAPSTIKNLGLINVNISGGKSVGGLVGYLDDNSTIDNSFATGAVTGTSMNVGGLAGWIQGSTIKNSFASVAVNGTDTVVGGLVGYMGDGNVSPSTITNSYATGTVNGNNNVGGLVGVNADSSTVTNSYATGAVTGTGEQVGGLVGDNAGTVTKSYATGAVNGGTNVGGLVGLGGTVTNSFYDRNTTGQDDTGKGTPKTTAQMKDIATFSDAGWDIVDGWQPPNGNDWGICQNISYPFLLWQYDVSPCGALGDSAYRHCTTNNQRWYDDAMDANANRVLILPYSPGSASGWWAGYALINTHATRNIPQDALCLAAMDRDGRSFAKVHGRPLFSRNMFVGTVPDIDPDEPRWANQLVLGVFKHPDATVDALHGFTMMGDTIQAAGYFADNRGARTRLSFDYTPGTPWWRGFALYNNHPRQTAYVRVVAHQADGRPVELKDRDRIVLSPGRMLVEVIESILPNIDPDQGARVEFLAETSDGDELEALHGFVIFGDGRQAMGYLGQ